jgi:hypothetical protein
MKTAISLLIIFLISYNGICQTPQAFNYQAVARDLTGNPITNQDIGLRISILQGSTSGYEVFSETHLVTTNGLGLFNIQIGNGSVVAGSIADIDWGNGDHFIQIELDEENSGNYQLIGTSQLLSVPYALYSSNGSKWITTGNGINYDNGNVGVGTQNPTTTMYLKKPFGDVILTLETDEDNYGEDDNPRIDFLQDGKTVGFQVGLNQEVNSTRSGNDFYFQPIWIDSLQTPLLTLSIDDGPWGTANYNPRVGIGTILPGSKLQVTGGDIFIEDIGSGVIMKSPDGQCWRYTPDNTGQLVPTAINCPEF